MFYKIFLVLCSTCLLFLQIESVSEKDINLFNGQQKLVRNILTNYNKQQKPSGTVQVKFALNLNQILNIKAKDQVFELNTFIDHEWVDPRLSWVPEENNNITNLRVAAENLWIPDTFVYTTADKTGFLLSQEGAYFVISHEGKIFWPNPLPHMKVRCKIGIAWFPFDEQLCTVVIGSWSHTLNYLNYTLMNTDTHLAGYQENSEWTLIDYKPFRKEIFYDNWIENFSFSEIHYKILIRRKPLFVLQNYCIPALMLCLITLMTFFIPFPQESQMGISIMLTFAVLKLKLSDDVPAQSDNIPLFNIYFIGCMLNSLTSLLWFSIANNLRTQEKLPKFVSCFVKKIVCPLMFIKDYKVIYDEDDKGNEEYCDFSDADLVSLFNNFMFRLFSIYLFLLNFVLLYLLPYHIKTPLRITS